MGADLAGGVAHYAAVKSWHAESDTGKLGPWKFFWVKKDAYRGS